MNDDQEYIPHSRASFPAIHESVDAFRSAWQKEEFAAAQGHFHDIWKPLEPWLSSRAQAKGLKQEEAEDVVAEALMGLYKVLQGGQEIGNLRALVLKILERRISDFWREIYGRSRESIAPNIDTGPKEVRATDNLSFDWDEVRSDDAPMHEAIDDHDFSTATNAILVALDETQKRVLILRFLRGCSVSDTAATLGLSVDQVKKETAKAVSNAKRIAVEQKHIEREVLK